MIFSITKTVPEFASVEATGSGAAKLQKDSMGFYKIQNTNMFNGFPVWKLDGGLSHITSLNSITRYLYRGNDGWHISEKLKIDWKRIRAVPNNRSPFAKELVWQYHDGNGFVEDETLKVSSMGKSYS